RSGTFSRRQCRISTHFMRTSTVANSVQTTHSLYAVEGMSCSSMRPATQIATWIGDPTPPAERSHSPGGGE
ncbi:MAG: hypothetical protein KDA71_06865, partial [Planctomycetales bacterium]|nr:hypothetical protein [Planctomycetales bacterium]